MNWLKISVRWPSATMSCTCSISASSLVDGTAAYCSSTRAASRLSCRSRVSERKIANRFFYMSSIIPSTFCRSRCRWV